MTQRETLDQSDSGRIAGIDYGTVRIGVAVTDREQRIASPIDNYTRRGEAADADYFRRLAKDEQIVGFVVGLPVHLDGRESQKSTEAREFGHWLQQTTGMPVVFFDERFTTAEAENVLAAAEFTKKQRQARLDKLAAQILLTAYLEAGKPPSFEPRGLDH
jgi:putative Holliday junction resolvase